MHSYDLIVTLTVIILVIIFIYLFAKREERRNKKRYTFNPYKLNIKRLDQLDGRQFELYLYVLLNELGYSDVNLTAESRDFGADLIFTDSKGVRNVIQAKRQAPDNLVGISAIQEIYTSMKYYQAKKAIVLTTSTFTKTSEKLAAVNGVLLINRNDLHTLIEELKKGNRFRARKILESEPYVISEPWVGYKDMNPVIKKGYTVEVPEKEAL
ncbi:restriction endonuclease [Caldalkalibacillus salinus]|uniref:restriction endonuclease n=1 Tax=Caldalkalibacillus salinus TaxID=2803787 RepID=UPI001924F8AF|nr:restriction endonuclease [Caldalkalibacillus salinus]